MKKRWQADNVTCFPKISRSKGSLMRGGMGNQIGRLVPNSGVWIPDTEVGVQDIGMGNHIGEAPCCIQVWDCTQ